MAGGAWDEVRSGNGGGRPPPVSLNEISRVLEETARLVRQHAHATGEAEGPAEEPPALAARRVRAIIAARRMRRIYLGLDPADAPWSIMLELYASRLEGRRVSQTDLYVSAAVPQTTALRATVRMIETGLLTRRADPDDKRLVLIALSDAAADRMRAYLAATHPMAALAV